MTAGCKSVCITSVLPTLTVIEKVLRARSQQVPGSSVAIFSLIKWGQFAVFCLKYENQITFCL